ncbi:MAG TPA: TonB-dependent receptor [Chthoniobacterales bacterium]|nr:TonB-dependent receptor [Chthoniobacterales bacterium]
MNRQTYISLRAILTVAAVTTYFALGVPIRAQDSVTTQGINVTGEPVATPHPHDDTRPKLEHIMREVSGTQITVTKKATVINLEKEAPIEGNNLQQLFTKAPGLVVSEQQNPGQFNFSYRGLGNPQESEYTLFLQDGLPLMAEWIGFPTLYYQPVPQSISEIQFIRGGSSLLYGPEPAPAINFVTKHPVPGTPWGAYFEQTGGADGFYNSYAAVQEAAGPLEFRADADYQTSDGQRNNGWYDLWQANGYLGYRPNNDNLIAFDVHASRFNGGDPGKLTRAQFDADQNFASTPYNENWVDRYNFVLRYEANLGDGWLMQAKGWFTHQDIDSRAAGNLGLAKPTDIFGTVNPTSTTFGYEEFNNGGIDLRFRKKWGDGTMFKGSALTFGGVAYHGEAPFQRYTLMGAKVGAADANFGPNFLYAPRGSRANTIRNGVDVGPTLDQNRSADYQAFFVEDLIRIGSFHIVPSFRLDHENVEVDSSSAPFLGPNGIGPAQSISADHWVPMWGIGLGNDFGQGNETYFSASTGWRPTRFFDIAGTTRTVKVGTDVPDPFESLDIELGVHGTPFKGFWYDVGLFWMEFSNRTENQAQTTIDFVIVNTGNTRHRGLEAEVSYDLLAPFQHDVIASTTADAKSPKDATVAAPIHPLQLIVFSNVQFLDAKFTESALTVAATGQSFVGNEPAYAPDWIWKGGVTFQKEKCFRITISGVHSSEQFWQDSNQPLIQGGVITVPAIIPSYTVWNLSSEWYVTKNVRLIAGVSNLADEKYYSRAFLTGLIDPAARRSGYAGLSVEF